MPTSPICRRRRCDRQFGPGPARRPVQPTHHWLWNPAVAHGNMGAAEQREEIDAYDGALAHLDAESWPAARGPRTAAFSTRRWSSSPSDHGEEFGEHGVYDHGYSLYRTGLQVPLVVVAPGSKRPGVLHAAAFDRWRATVVDLVGLSGTPFPGPHSRRS